MIDCAGLWIFSQQNPSVLPDDLPLTYALSLHVMTKTRRNKRGLTTCQGIPAAMKRNVGNYIRESIGLIFYNINQTIERQEREREELRRSMGAPLMPYRIDH